MSLSVNGYGQQALLYQLMRRNGGSNTAPADEAAPVASAPRAATPTGDSVAISSALADFLSLLGGSLTTIAQAPATAATATPADFEATLAGVASEPAPVASGTTPNGAADLASVLDAYAAIARGG